MGRGQHSIFKIVSRVYEVSLFVPDIAPRSLPILHLKAKDLNQHQNRNRPNFGNDLVNTQTKNLHIQRSRRYPR